MQLNPAVDYSSLARFATPTSLVGEGFREVPTNTLVEKGDEFKDSASGRFLPFSLEAIGRPVPAGMLVRRVNRARSTY
jgi:hypothetical protein